MKKIISIAMIFLVILFANTTFAESDQEIVEEILNSAEITIEQGTISSNGTSRAFSAPKMVITAETIKSVEEKYNVDVSIKDGKIYIGENSYPITIESPSGRELVSDQQDGFIKYTEHITVGMATEINMENKPDLNATYKEGNDVEITFYGYAATDCDESEGGYNNYYGNPNGVDVNVRVTDNSGNVISTRGGKTEGSNNPINEVNIDNGSSSSLNLSDENTYEDENGNKRFMLQIPEGGEGAYVFQIIGADGVPIPIQNGMIFDANGNPVYVQYAEGDVFSGVLSSGYYYIVLPEGATVVETKRMSDSTDHNQTQLAGMTTSDEFTTGESGDFLTDFFEKVFFYFIMAIGKMLQGLISIIAGESLSIDKLVFDDYAYTSLSFFRNDLGRLVSNPYLEGAVDPLNFLFNLFTNISLVAYLVILVYMGIRVLLISTAEKKAKYKEMVADWVKGVAILLLFPFVIRYAILLNHAFVKYIQSNLGNGLSQYSAVIPSKTGSLASVEVDMDELKNENGSSSSGSYMDDMYNLATKNKRITYALCWLIMLIQVIQFLIVYLKRLIKIMFLIVIFPFTALSYAIDKIGDGRSQAFNNWCKEFVLEVFIQSFHAMNYVLVMGIVFGLLGGSGKGNWFLAIIGITYVAKGGDILRGLFAQMSGGGAGGPMSVAGSLLKTRMVMDAVKGIRSTASRMVGSDSMLGKGVSHLNQAYDTHLAGITAQRQAEARDAVKKYNADTAKWDKSTARFRGEEVAKKLLNDGEHMPAIEFMDSINKLNNLDDEDRNFVLDQLNENDRKQIGELLTHAAAAQLLKKPGATNFDIHTSVNILINDKTRGGNSLIDRYDNKISAVNKVPDIKELRKMRVESSIQVDDEKARNRDSKNVALPDNKSGRVMMALNRISNAHKGEYTLDEIQEAVDVVENAKREADEQGEERISRMIDNAEKNRGYSLEEFKTNLAVQQINHSGNLDISRSKSDQDKLDRAIRQVKEASRDENMHHIIKNLRTDVNNLQEGYLPDLRDEARPSENIQDSLYSSVNDDEHTQYLYNKADELRKQARREAALGTIRTAAGAVATATKIGVGTATAGTLVGAAGKSDVIEQIAVAGPVGFNLGTGAVDKIGQAASTVSSTAGDVVDTVRTIAGRPAPAKEKIDLKTNLESMDINRKYYEQKAATQDANRRVADAEKERERLLRELRNRRK